MASSDHQPSPQRRHPASSPEQSGRGASADRPCLFGQPSREPDPAHAAGPPAGAAAVSATSGADMPAQWAPQTRPVEQSGLPTNVNMVGPAPFSMHASANRNMHGLSADLMQATALAGRYLGQSLRLMVGLPDYSAYLAHMAKAHPDDAVMSYEQFFVDRQQARYSKGKSGGCC